jgi:WD40 repeat protein
MKYLVILSIVSGVGWLLRPSKEKDQATLTIDGRSGGMITALAFATDGLSLAYSTQNRSDVRIWDVQRNSDKLAIQTSGDASELLFAPSGEVLVWNSAWEDTLQKWDITGHRVSSRRPSTKFHQHLLYSARNNIFAYISSADLKDSTLFVEDANSGLKRFSFNIPDRVYVPLTITSDGSFLAVGTVSMDSGDQIRLGEKVSVWDAISGKVISQFHILGSPQRLEFSPDGRLLASWSINESMEIKIWNVSSGKLHTTLKVGVKATMTSVKISADGQTLAAGAGDTTPSIVPGIRWFDRVYGEVRVWDLTSSKNVELFVLSRPVTRIAFSPDGRSLAAGCDDGTVKAWINRFGGNQRRAQR